MPQLDIDATRAKVRESTVRLGELSPGFLDAVKSAVVKLSLPDNGQSARHPLVQDVEDLAHFTFWLAAYSLSRLKRYVKRNVNRATHWYLRYFSDQVNAFAQANVVLSETILERLEELEREISSLRDEQCGREHGHQSGNRDGVAIED